MSPPAPVARDLVLVGGGHSHVAVLKRFGMKPPPGVRLTLICRELHTPYSGMLPGLVAGHYGFDDAHIDLGPLARFARARLVHDEAVAIDRGERRVRCRAHPPIAYDILSLDVGAAPLLPDGAENVASVVPVKPIGRFLDHWQALVARVRATRAPRRIAVIGAGAGGVELILAARHRLRHEVEAAGGAPVALAFLLVTDGDAILPTHAPSARARLVRILAEHGIEVLTGHRVVRVEPGALQCANGARIAADEVLCVTAAAAPAWLAETGLALDGGGFVAVRDTLQSVTDPAIFAAGDAAHMVAAPREKAGVYAVRQGPVLVRNLRSMLSGGTLHPYVAQRRHLALIGTGDDYAVASRGAWSAEGRWVWRWKQSIDRRFMRQYNHLPAMTAAPETDAAPRGDALAAMRCGGCGAKIGSDVLKRALGRIAQPQGEGVVIGLAEPDDAAVIAVPPGKVLVQSVDFFRAFIDDPFVFGKIAANHALGDIYAMGGEPHTALAIATLPVAPEDKLAELLFQLLSGAVEVLTASGATLVGGHTGEGAELALGFAVNGLADQGRLLRKGGMRPGDRLVLTKALGTGTLFAADMRLKAKGRWIEAALQSMLQSNRDAAACLVRHGATAATDVTGFGLAGHLVEMVEASGVAVELDLGAVPALDGAADTLRAGIVSTLQPENLRFRRALGGAAAERHPLYPLLFDPQTAGGLLASVPADCAPSCLQALRLLGYGHVAEIGRVVAAVAGAAPVTVVA